MLRDCSFIKLLQKIKGRWQIIMITTYLSTLLLKTHTSCKEICTHGESDSGAFVETAGLAGTDLSGWQRVFCNGSPVGFDIDNRDIARVKVKTERMTANGFMLVIETWRHTRVYGVDVSWLALGHA